MPLDVEIPADLMAQLESAARLHGLTLSNLTVLAIAEKLARMEHEDWLGQIAQMSQQDRDDQDAKGPPFPAKS